ncbi:bifunctional glycosyltransferase family 2 protein/class I SAM-dependent methyltransferase [Fodinisporobacter ferrooxydans]|uniref:Bifunctional glycosyltransferase family 2 protein/class I SAM-dependent methyltransferase n=1 Tax=Fodinisporobacter ferrooxydans TaxID=2901836 RepID=A0ABY4CE66_9BACL|nr:bifunctional glycosyltransferase family 2 protein/class I SAM-dependent methyltransferase [Alicyclobacillaceae bacterium MYW30-H2]
MATGRITGKKASLTSIIIPTCNKWEYTKQCLESIRQFTDAPYELIVVDNGSQDVTVQELRRMEDVFLIENNANLGFPRACNQGMAQAKGDQLLILNNDIVVSRQWLSNMLHCLNGDPRNGAVGPVTNYISGVQARPVGYSSLAEYFEFVKDYNHSDPAKWFCTLRLVGFCLLIRRDVYEKVGGFDERFGKGNFEDDDYCMRMRRAGYRLVVAADTYIHHYGSVTNRMDPEYAQLLETNRLQFVSKWGIDPLQMLQYHDALAAFLPPADRILDAACGGGGLGLNLKNKGMPFVAGIESDALLAVDARTVLDEVWVGDAETIRLPYPGGWFDAILLADALLHFANPKAALAHLATYLKQGGYVVASISNATYVGVIKKLLEGNGMRLELGRQYNGNSALLSLDEIIWLFEQAGLQIETIGGMQEMDDKLEIMVHELLQLRERLGLGELVPSALDQWKTKQYYIRAIKR